MVHRDGADRQHRVHQADFRVAARPQPTRLRVGKGSGRRAGGDDAKPASSRVRCWQLRDGALGLGAWRQLIEPRPARVWKRRRTARRTGRKDRGSATERSELQERATRRTREDAAGDGSGEQPLRRNARVRKRGRFEVARLQVHTPRERMVDRRSGASNVNPPFPATSAQVAAAGRRGGPPLRGNPSIPAEIRGGFPAREATRNREKPRGFC